MAVPQSKQELISAINHNFDKLMQLVASVPADQTSVKSLEGHSKNTLMSVHDLLAYLIGWNELVLKWLHRDETGLSIDFPETGYKWNELGALAQKFYHDYAELNFSTLLLRLTTARQNIIAAIEKRDDHTLYGKEWYTKWTMGRMIQFNTSSPYANATGRIRKWLKQFSA